MPLIPTPVAIPHTFQDNVNEANSGVQVNENLVALKNPLDLLIATVEGALYIGGHAVQLRMGEVSGTADGSNNVAVTFSPAFATAVLFITATATESSVDFVYLVSNRTRTGFNAFFNAGAAGHAEHFNYFAVGY